MPQYTQQQLSEALHNASGAGDTAAAQRIAQMLHDQFGIGQTPTPKEPNAPSTLSYVWNQFKVGGRQGLGLPAYKQPDWAQLSPQVKAEMHARGIAPLDTGATMPTPQKPPLTASGQESYPAEVAGNIAQIAGTAAIPEVGTIGKMVREAKGAAKAIPLVKEAAALGLSGVGATEGQHIAGDIGTHGLTPAQIKKHEDWGYAIGSMMGPMAAMKIVDGVVRGGNWVTKMMEKAGIKVGSRAAQEAAAQRIVRGRVGEYMKSPAVSAHVAEAAKVGEQIPGFEENLTLGRRTGVPEVQQQEMALARTPEVHARAQRMEAGLTQAIQAKKEEAFPSTMVKPNSAAALELEKRANVFNEESKSIDRQIRQLSSKFKGGRAEQIGTKMSDLITRRWKASQATKNALYGAVKAEADKSKMQVQVGDVFGAAQGIRANHWSLFQNEPGVVGRVLSLFRKGSPVVKERIAGTIRTGRRAAATAAPKEVSFGTFYSLVQDANAEARMLAQAARSGNTQASSKLAQLMPLKVMLDAKLAEMGSPEYGKVGQLLQKANEYYSTVYSPLFKQGAAAEILRTGRFGEKARDNADIVSREIFKRNNPSGLREFLDAAGHAPAAYQAAENGLYDMLAQKVRSGKLNAETLRQFVANHSQSIKLLPGVGDKLKSTGNAIAALEENAKRITQHKRTLAQSMLAKVSNTETPSQVVRKALASPDYMKTLLSHQDASTRQALAGALAEHAMRSRDPEAILHANRDAFEKALGKQRFNDLNAIAVATRIKNSVEIPPTPTGLPTGEADPLKAAIGTSSAGLASMIANRARGMNVSKFYYGFSMGMRWFSKLRNEDVQRLTTEAIYDPKVAHNIAQMLEGKAPQSAYRADPHKLLFLLRTVGAMPSVHAPQDFKEKKQ